MQPFIVDLNNTNYGCGANTGCRDIDTPFIKRVNPEMYILDPSVGPKMPNVMPPSLEYSVVRKGPVLLNPNKDIFFDPDAEEMIMAPRSENTPMRKRDLIERQQIKVYPHMYNAYGLMEQDAARSEAERSYLNSQPSISLGGADYPIPEYYKLQALNACPNKNSRAGADYDMRIQENVGCVAAPVGPGRMVRQQALLIDNIDLKRQSGCGATNAGILGGNTPTNGRYGWTAGVPDADKKDFKCAQIKRQYSQATAIAEQQFGPRIAAPCKPERDPVFWNREQTRSEVNIFGDKEISRTLPAPPTYPNSTTFKTGFFELGPVIPPPNPLLLSNVSSSLQFQIDTPVTQTVDSGATAEELKLENTIEAFESRSTPSMSKATNPNIELQPVQTVAAAKEIVRSTGSQFGSVTPGHQETGYLHTSGLPDTGVQASRAKSEFGVARSNLEAEMKKIIAQTVGQQARALMTISDLRHSIAGLQQRIVDSRAHNQAFDIARANLRLTHGLDMIEKLRDLIRAVQERRSRALDELKGPLTAAEFGSIETTLANSIKLMEENVRQYHANPADDAIEAFTGPHFQSGAQLGTAGYVMKKGFYDYPNVGGVGNNKLQSLKVGAKVKVILYERPNRGGKSLTYVGPRRVTLLPTLWTSTVSGIEVIDGVGPMIEVWDAPFYQGAQVRLPVGFYDYPDVGGIKAGKTQSLSIPDNINVTIYSQANRTGEKITFLGPQSVPFFPSGWSTKVFGIDVVLKR